MQVDDDLLSIKQHARAGDWETVEQRYIAQINRQPDRVLYLALADVWEHNGKENEAQALHMRAYALSSFARWRIWIAGMLFCIGVCLWVWNRSRWSWIFVGSGLALLAFYDDVRYKGTVLSAQTHVFHTPSHRGISLFSLAAGSVVGIIAQESGYSLIEYEQKRGWVEQNHVLSWNPAQLLQVEE